MLSFPLLSILLILKTKERQNKGQTDQLKSTRASTSEKNVKRKMDMFEGELRNRKLLRMKLFTRFIYGPTEALLKFFCFVTIQITKMVLVR